MLKTRWISLKTLYFSTLIFEIEMKSTEKSKVFNFTNRFFHMLNDNYSLCTLILYIQKDRLFYACLSFGELYLFLCSGGGFVRRTGIFLRFRGLSGLCQRNETGRDFGRAGTFFACGGFFISGPSLRCSGIALIRSENRKGKRKTATGGSRKKLTQGVPVPLFVHTKGLCLMARIYR